MCYPLAGLVDGFHLEPYFICLVSQTEGAPSATELEECYLNHKEVLRYVSGARAPESADFAVSSLVPGNTSLIKTRKANRIFFASTIGSAHANCFKFLGFPIESRLGACQDLFAKIFGLQIINRRGKDVIIWNNVSVGFGIWHT